MTAPLKALGYSLNSTDPTELGEARELLRRPGPARPRARLERLRRQARRPRRPSWASSWTGGIDELRDEPETADIEYIVPEDGTLYWMDTWVMLADAPHPEAAYAWLNFIHEPAIQAKETETNHYATPNDEAKKLVAPEILADPTVFVPDAGVRQPRGRRTTCRRTRCASRSGRSSARASAAERDRDR